MRKNPLHRKIPFRLLSMLAAGLLLLPLMFIPMRQLFFFSQSAEIRILESNSEKLEKMVFTSDAFSRLTFTRDQREFIYRGNMYDVHSITRWGNQVTVLALWDAPESGMMQAFQTQENPGGSTTPEVMRVGFMPYFLVETFCPDFRSCTNDLADYHDIRFLYSDPLARICSPPPEFRWI